MKASPAVRGLRAAVFAALCVLLAAGGHSLATGMAPPGCRSPGSWRCSRAGVR
ncbi:hypothetical protein ACFYO2_34770 [Streptomyces sp. NPDC006602]|uniref:hypothetical protein n=1 Tax=Streptomyces sp. NPDC006602 TaxID=3364751 RepID=UPI003691E732